MRKHIIGLAIFSFIVSAAAIVYAIFNVPEITQMYEIVSVPRPHYSANNPKMKSVNFETPAKIGKIDANSPNVRQAVFNLETKIMDLELQLNKFDNNEINGKIPLRFSFFRKDAKETRFITSENFTFGSDDAQYDSKTGSIRIQISYDWLNTLNSFDNLYVIAEVDSEYYQKATSTFDSRFAKAVTLFTDKTSSRK